jgi:hypothetical protein
MNPISLIFLVGCWKEFDQLPQVDINKIPFENSQLQIDSVFVSILDSNLMCPDGQTAPIFVVYPETEEALPVAVIFHSNPVAFITDFERSNAQLPDRLSADWVENKLWETLGLSKNPQDLYEDNQGYLPTALAENGFVQIYPGNCWGDFWHSDPENFPNAEHIAIESDEEDTANMSEPMFGEFTRMGRKMALSTINALSDPTLASEMGLDFPQAINAQEQHWIGLGEGGRAILELLALESIQDNLPSSVILDSVPMNLQPYLDAPTSFPLEYGTLSNVFVGEEGYPLSDLSMYSWNRVTFPERVGLIWSNGDTKMPQAALGDAVTGIAVEQFWQEDQNKSGHVFLNRDITLARRAVQFMKTGAANEAPEEEPEAPDEESEDTTVE